MSATDKLAPSRNWIATEAGRPASAVLWNGLGIGGRHVMQFMATIILARALSPDDFGLVGMIVVLTAFAAVCADLGLGTALVQHADLKSRHLDAAFWATAIAGLVLTILLWALAPAVAAFYDRPALTALTRGTALQFALNGVGVVPRALLMRGVQFRKLALIEFCTGTAAAVGAVALALAGAGAWALVGQLLIAAAAGSGLCAAFALWRPRSFAGPRELRNMASFSRHLVGFRAVNYWARNADNLLIGRVLGAPSLGLYALAYQLILLPLQQVARIVGDVMVPVMASCRSDLAQVRLAYVRAVQATAIALLPVMLGLVVVAGEAVPLLFGDDWDRAVPIVRILAVGGCFQALGVTVGWIYQSQGRSDVMFRWGIFAAVVAVIGIVVGLPWGVVGVAAGYTIAVVLLTPVSHLIASRLIQLRARELLSGVSPAVIASGFMAAGAIMARTILLAADQSTAIVLGGSVFVGGIVYGIGVALLRPVALDMLGTFIYWPRRARDGGLPRA